MARHVSLSKKPKLSSLQPKSRHPNDIVQAIIKPIKGGNDRWLSGIEEEKERLARWQRTFTRELASAYESHQQFVLDRRFLFEYLALVSDLFLFGALANVRIEWRYDTPPQSRGRTLSKGQQTHIYINISQAHGHRASPHDFVELVLGVVAHEALHAFYDQYACQSHDACKAKGGLSGHGKAWQRMALEVEGALRAMGVDGIDLHRQDAASTEEMAHRSKGSVWSPSRKDVLRFFGGHCPVTGKVYRRDWRDKFRAFFER